MPRNSLYRISWTFWYNHSRRKKGRSDHNVKEASSVEITNAEWEIMRIVWTLGAATSKQISQVMAVKKNWKMATTKTLLGRLVTKNYLETTRQGRAFIYRPTVDEQATINQLLEADLRTICQMHTGRSLAEILRKFTFTKHDLQVMQDILQAKMADAPTELPCDCVPAELAPELDHDEHTCCR